MTTPDYRNLRRSFELDEEQAALFSLLDPRLGSECLGYFRHPDCLRIKTPGDFLCGTCSQWCLDPDCKAPNRDGLAAKAQTDEWCQDCLEYIRCLDMPCGNRRRHLAGGGYSRICYDGFCNDRRTEAIQSGCPECLADSLCFGEPNDEVPREGFFVYELDSNYVGMTYNPSERQEEHRIRRYVSWQELHGRHFDFRAQYISRAVQYEAELFSDKYEEHWRSRRTHGGVERLIRWLSPMFDTRLDVYRAEWALKAYSFWPGGPRSEYERVRAFSSLPELVLKSAGLATDADGRVLFALTWQPSDRLGPLQIVPVEHYDLEYALHERNDWVSVSSGVRVDLRDSSGSYDLPLGNNIARSWRVRGVSGGRYPGPWAVLNLTDADLSQDLSNLVHISGVAFELQNPASSTVHVDWTIENRFDGLHFVVERRNAVTGDCIEIDSSTKPFVDHLLLVDVGRFSYRVRCTWMGVASQWVPAGSNRTIVVGGPSPGTVRSLSYKLQDDGIRLIDWQPPEWQGHADVTHYEVERYIDHWHPLVGVKAEPIDEQVTVADADIITVDCGYRVRAINAHGSGPWQEVYISQDDMVKHIRKALRIEALRVSSFDAARGTINLDWDINESPSDVGFEIERTCGARTFQDVGMGCCYVDTHALRLGDLFFYRARATLLGVYGEWSDYVGAVVENDPDYKLVPPGGQLRSIVVLDVNSALDGKALSTFESIAAPPVTVTRSRIFLHPPTVLKRATELMDHGIEIVALICDRNKGGVEAIWNGVRCFVPTPLLSAQISPSQRVGQFARFNIKEVEDRQLVLTEINVLERLRLRTTAEFNARQRHQMEIARSVGLNVGDKVQLTTVNSTVEGTVDSIVELENDSGRTVAIIDQGKPRSPVWVPFEVWDGLNVLP